MPQLWKADGRRHGRLVQREGWEGLGREGYGGGAHLRLCGMDTQRSEADGECQTEPPAAVPRRSGVPKVHTESKDARCF